MVRLVATTLALTAALLAGCGGSGDDRAKVEANLQHYLVDPVPVGNRFPIGAFPIGAGRPWVKDNGCKDRHIKVEKGRVMSSRSASFKIEKDVALWTCVVKFGTLATLVNVAVDDNSEVVAAVPGELLREEEPNASRPSAGWSPYP